MKHAIKVAARLTAGDVLEYAPGRTQVVRGVSRRTVAAPWRPDPEAVVDVSFVDGRWLVLQATETVHVQIP